VALLGEEFPIAKLSLHSDLRRRVASRLALPCTSSFFYINHYNSATATVTLILIFDVLTVSVVRSVCIGE